MHTRSASSGLPVAAVLGGFVARSRWEDIPGAVVREAQRSLLNFFGLALGTAHEPAVLAPLHILRDGRVGAGTTVIGHPEPLEAMGAAFVNAISANLLDYDDTHLDTVIHPTAPVAPAALAFAERDGVSTREALHAFILGAEVECRIGNAVSPGHYARGWHITATCGVFGAAAASARLLGLDAAQTGTALGIAASQSAGLVENLATAAKNVGVGNAARNGMLAALLARAGYTAAPAAIEGPLGWALAMGDALCRERIGAGLGTQWEIAKNTYKPYPAGIVFHSVIDAAFALRARLAVTAGDVARVTVAGPELLLSRGNREVRNERDARVSLHHCFAVAFARGTAGLADFAAPAVADPAVAALRAIVRPELDAALPVGACRVEVQTRDGRTEATTVIEARGSRRLPLTDAELEAKFRANTARSGRHVDADRRIAAVWSMHELNDSARLMRLMTPAIDGEA